MLEFKKVRHLRLRGVTIANSPGWTVHAHDCDDLHIHGITIANCLYGPNTDGLDLNGCRDICFTGCVIRQVLRAIQIEMWDTGTVENLVVSNLTGTLHTEIPLQRAIYVNVGCNERASRAGSSAPAHNTTETAIVNIQTRGISLS